MHSGCVEVEGGAETSFSGGQAQLRADEGLGEAHRVGFAGICKLWNAAASTAELLQWMAYRARAADTSEMCQSTLEGPRQKNVHCLGSEGGGEVLEFLDCCDGSIRLLCDMLVDKAVGSDGGACCDEPLFRMVDMQRWR